MNDDGWLQSIQSVHVLGAGLRSDRPAHQAFHDAGHLGYRMVPVHPKDAGNTILGRPIRSDPWQSLEPELFVLFLSMIFLNRELKYPFKNRAKFQILTYRSVFENMCEQQK